ncbi:hypothetical protein MO973_11645 [Paenibacillus sp. TRM 82003]|nr:hypothetical protein [Paenibacillus sp. TRM 82003]
MTIRRWLFLPLPVFLFLWLFTQCFNQPVERHYLGDNEEAIERTITSLEGYENTEIVILGIRDKDEIRDVAFLSNRRPGYIEFRRNNEGRYEMTQAQTQGQENLGIFVTQHFLLIVTNSENRYTKLQVTVNGRRVEQSVTPRQAGAHWVSLPESDEEHTFGDFVYFDEFGKPVDE